ncbi:MULTISPECIES: hypothetical protein [Mycobacterium]|uniref:ESX-1 secretion-associated protein EspA/EspE-like domain-containing protein n=1 Tax=Mycobacterium kiyosense TaxID=2871094 RepID=A0A9P3QBU8_9MYCO|nr:MULTISPECIES: hypothetical protein [Mycobacterium]BDB43720.1 hypothetical protein IWGMT90018_41660 [Mycobacterium kiyosense]BDE15279.1 hypothetical protein MKCMC460_41390 [Mycobacterium sp. 20KCMC460]GLB84509.1 hypothetical protein SRL2020028_37650 [Mycobacterium kiyosense]GLB91870.1 hypothetical protein SRL2020130_46870 [Mycobacterium kiyosense]GLB97943.1 hypothetical protein SRL2020226_47190 [Mycobacterium kiyosense]
MSIGDELQQYYRDLVKRTDELERAINEAADSWLARTLDLDEEIRAAGKLVIGALRNQVIPTVKKIADTLSMSDVLRDHKNGWQTIDSGARGISDKLDDEVNGIRGQVHWTGAAANAYGVSVGHQKTAVTGLSTAAQAIQTSLEAVASALDTAGYTIIPGVAGLLLSIAGAIATAVTVVGLPATLAFVLTTIATFLASAAAIIAGFVSVENAQSDQANALQRALDAQGDWPTPNVASYNSQQRDQWIPL